MKRGSFVVKLVFGVIGAIYAIVGAVLLAIVTHITGDIRLIFSIPEDDLALPILGVVCTTLGVVFLLVALILALADRRRASLREELLSYGARVTGTVTDVRTDHTIRVNRRSPKVARVRCELPAGEVTLKSHWLWDICPAVGDQAEVIYDPMNEKRYVIQFAEEN